MGTHYVGVPATHVLPTISRPMPRRKWHQIVACARQFLRHEVVDPRRIPAPFTTLNSRRSDLVVNQRHAINHPVGRRAGADFLIDTDYRGPAMCHLPSYMPFRRGAAGPRCRSWQE